MSIQENHLAAIAQAIRDKDGTSDPIPALDFPARIRAIPSGGSSGGSCGIVILENWNIDESRYAPCVRLGDFTQAKDCLINAQILEGYT